MIKVAVIGIITIFLALILKNQKQEYAILASIAGGLLIFTFTVDKLEGIIGLLNKLKNYISINTEYISLLFKITGITYIAELASDICKDAGYSVIGSQIELAAKLCIMAISMPVLIAIVDTINALIT